MSAYSVGERAIQPVTVSALNEYIKQLVSLDEGLQAVFVCGEISNFTAHRSGHLYFSLKDEHSLIKSVMFRSAASVLRFRPEAGMRVVVFGNVSIYTRDGQYQLYVSHMEPDGVGALALQYEQLKAKLQAEGLFAEDRKKPLPAYPSKIGVITSPTGAAVRDIITVLRRRYPMASVLLYPAAVQGTEAPFELVQGIRCFSKSDVDVIVIGRGGGAPEDLFAFNDEALVRAVAACPIPVISAVGHEVDFTLCDFAADMRAPTPSAAAELAVPDMAELTLRINSLSNRSLHAMKEQIRSARRDVDRLAASRIYQSPKALYEDGMFRVMQLQTQLESSMTDRLSHASHLLQTHSAKLQALSPLSVLSRGYAVITSDDVADGRPSPAYRHVTDLKEKDTVRILFEDGYARAEILAVSPRNKTSRKKKKEQS